MPMIQDVNRDYHPPLRRPEKDEERERIARDLEEFLQRGGRVEQLPPGATGNPMLAKPIHWDAEHGRMAGGADDKRPGRVR